jgi:sugar transferase (PEP-CTERM system associated)
MHGSDWRQYPSAVAGVRFFQHYILAPLLVLACFEATVCLLAPWLASCILGVWLGPLPHAAAAVSVFAGTFMVGCTAMGLYNRRQRARHHGILLRTLAAIFLSIGAVALVSYVAPAVAMGRGVLGLAALLVLVLTALGRLAFGRLVDEDVFKRRVLVYGAGRRALGVLQLRRRSDQRGFHVVAFVRTDDEHCVVPSDRALTLDGRLLDYCRATSVDEIIVAMDDRRRAFPVHELLACRLDGIAVVDILDFLERETGKVRLDVLNPSWIIFSPGFDRSRRRELSKRSLDLLASLGLLLVTCPLMLATVVAIKLEDGLAAPILYRQRRVGLEGRVFDVFKFRSMRVDAERPGQAVWAQKSDARVTRVGALIRKVRIDELPQIFNVLRGDMSLVGPRPERPEFVAGLEDRVPYYRERHCVKPGITGWAQLCYPYGSSEHDAAEKLQYDLYYVKNHSLLFDLMILLQTAEVVLWGQGAR